jgi:hypothetical protein
MSPLKVLARAEDFKKMFHKRFQDFKIKSLTLYCMPEKSVETSVSGPDPESVGSVKMDPERIRIQLHNTYSNPDFAKH